jgi:drug/metabolite transporter (DMT)-like permease
VDMAARAVSPFNVFLMLCLITFWGSSFVVVKEVLKEGLTPVSIATFRFLVAGALFLIALLLNKARQPSYRLLIEKKDVKTLVFLALSGVTLFFMVQYTGIYMAGPSVAAIMVCLLAPVLISVLSARLFRERLKRRQIVGIGVAALGTFTIVAGDVFSSQGSSAFLQGSLLLLLTPLMWAGYTIVGKKLMEKYSPFLVVAYVSILGGLLLVPFSLIENSFRLITAVSMHGWISILFLAFTCSLLGYYLWFYVMKQVKAAVASSFLFGEPLITALFAVTFVGDRITVSVIAGGLLVFVGVIVVTGK